MWRVKSPGVCFLWSLRGANQHTAFELTEAVTSLQASPPAAFGRFKVKESYLVLLLKSRNSQKQGACFVSRLIPDFFRRDCKQEEGRLNRRQD